jgi:hypothetical protein
MRKPTPKPAPQGLAKKAPPAKLNPAFVKQQMDSLNRLGGQIQALAVRLEALRAQGAGHTPEFKALEQLLTSVQDKLVLAEAKLKG